MKHFIVVLLTVLSISSNAYCQEPVAETISNCDSLTHILAIKNAVIDSLTNVTSILNSTLQETIKSSSQESTKRDREIESLKAQIENLQNSTIKTLEVKNDSLQRRLLSIASYYIYQPYNVYTINKIALPAFNATIGTPAYVKYQNRLVILQNYRADIDEIIEFIEKAKEDMSDSSTTVRNENAKICLESLMSLPAYTRYVAYDDWKKTYLGGYLKSIMSLLEKPNDTTADKLDSLKIQLESVINNQ